MAGVGTTPVSGGYKRRSGFTQLHRGGTAPTCAKPWLRLLRRDVGNEPIPGIVEVLELHLLSAALLVPAVGGWNVLWSGALPRWSINICQINSTTRAPPVRRYRSSRGLPPLP